MKRKCFTLVELLVVIGIIAVLMGILLPALSAVKRTAQRVVCGSNLAGIGKAMLLYANEYAGEYPRAGGANSFWGDAGSIDKWTDQGGDQYGREVGVTITSSLYLLVKFVDVQPGQFVCKGDAGAHEFKLSDAPEITTAIDDVTDVWDFGSGTDKPTTYWPGQYNSYAYHNPYENETAGNSFALGSQSSPASPVCADRNPYWDRNAMVYLNGGKGTGACSGDPEESAPSCDTSAGYKDENKTGNTAAHQRDGQNVLFNDTHVRFERFPNVGIGKDNIWKTWSGTAPPSTNCDRETGEVPTCGDKTDAEYKAPYSETDAFLVSETNDR